MNGTSTITEFRDAVLDPAKRAHYRLAWLSTVDHKRIAVLYMMTALVFFIIGGTEALFMRLQLAVLNNHFLQPDTFNQLFTMHGTTMIFLVVMPVLFGLVNYVLPLQIGARDMAFPRLNAFGFWCVPFGGILLHFSVLAGGAPAVGWFSYAPLSETPYSSSPGVDYWAVAIFVLGIGSLSFAINTIATVISLRGPGMTMRRLPLFTWINFVNAFIILFALPVLNAGLAMILIDRQLQGHFFLPIGGGSAVLWQHIFWAFGHPEVYILALPAFGIVSEIIPVFSRKPIFGYEFVAAFECSHSSPQVWRLGTSHVHRRDGASTRCVFRHFLDAHCNSNWRKSAELDRNDGRWADPFRCADVMLYRVSHSIPCRGPHRNQSCQRGTRLAD